MARIPYADRDNAPEPVAKLLDELPPLNLFLMMAHAEDTVRDFVRLGNALLFKGKLDPKLRELAILRVGHLSKAHYEIHQHEKIAFQLEIPKAKVEATARGADAKVFDETEQAVLRFVDDVVKNVKAGEATFNALSGHLGYREMQELTLTVGYYMMVARFLETFEVDLEENDVGLRVVASNDD